MNLNAGSISDRCIGLTGGVACGKSTIGTILKNLSYVVVDADQISRQVMAVDQPAYHSIIQHFGSSIVNPDKTLNRRLLREVVFADYNQLDILESIVTPHMQNALVELAQSIHGIWFYEAAILLKHYSPNHFLQVWYATCPLEVQIERLMKRDNISRELALQMIGRQLYNTDGCIQISTDTSVSEVEKNVHTLLDSLKGRTS